MIFGLFGEKTEVDFYRKKTLELLEENWRLKKALNIRNSKCGNVLPYNKDDPDDVSYLKGCIHGLETGAIACLFIKDTGFSVVPDQKKTLDEIGKQINRYKRKIRCLKMKKNSK